MDRWRAFVTGLNYLDRYTRPMVESFKRWNNVELLTVVDNGSRPEYPTEIGGARVVRASGESLANGLNVGMMAAGPAEWIVYMNNDITVTGSFDGLIKRLGGGTVYGPEKATIAKVEYLVGYFILMPWAAWMDVGPFDEGYAPYTYEDVDWCYRAMQRGWKLEKIEMPMEHVTHGSRGLFPTYEEIRSRNQRKFLEKFGLTKGEDEL